MKYKIYYADEWAWTESRAKHGSGGGMKAPGKKQPISTLQPQTRGVIAIVQGDPQVGWYICTGADYYIQRSKRWYGVDFFAMIEYLDELGLIDFGIGWKRVKRNGKWVNVDMVELKAFIEETGLVLFGRMVSSDEYLAIMQVAEDDREFAKREAMLPTHTVPFREFEQDYRSEKAKSREA